jgi:hypothetical protein
LAFFAVRVVLLSSDKVILQYPLAAIIRTPGTNMNGSFDVFLSHNSKDKPTVRQLAKALQARGLQVWLDEEQLVPGRPWQEALERVIQAAHTAAVLVGKDGLGPWEIPEMRACLSQFIASFRRVFGVLMSQVVHALKPFTKRLSRCNKSP